MPMVSAQDHMSYIHEKVNPILEALVTAVLLERPEDPVSFMIKWLSEQSTDKAINSAEVDKLTEEIERLKAKQQELLKGVNASSVNASALEGTVDPSWSGGAPVTPLEEEDEDEEDEDDDDDEVEDMPAPSTYKKGPRSSVSAEAYGEWNKKKTDYTPPVYAKSPEIEQRIHTKLASSFLFSSLDEKDKAIIVSAMKIVQVQPEERIIKQGDEGDCLYVIDSGVLDCYKTLQGEEKLVATVGAGDAFGELALLYNCPRAASVVCREKAELCELDRETFNFIVKESASKKRQLYEGFLKSVKILKNLDTYEVMRIADALKVQTYAKGEYVIRQGDPGNEFFMLEDGSVTVTKTQEDGSEVNVNSYGTSDYFGELALLKNEPRAANVIAASDIKVVTLDRRTFKRLLGPLQDILPRTY